jgi:hypothetical protein
MIAMFMGEKNAIEFVRGNTALLQAEHKLPRA